MSSDNQDIVDESTAQIEDPDALNQRLRVQRINESRQTVIETYRELSYMADVSEAQKAKILQSNVTAFLSDIVYLMLQHGGERYKNEKLGTVTLPPPDNYLEILESNQQVLQAESDAPEPREYTIRGIYGSNSEMGYLDVPAEFSAEWTLLINKRHNSQPQPVSAEVTAVTPIELSMEAFKLGAEFLANHGLDARLGEQDVDPNPV